MSYTGLFCWSLEAAQLVSKRWCREAKEYCTYVKGEPHDPTVPEECWALTNRFDPKVRKEDANTST